MSDQIYLYYYIVYQLQTFKLDGQESTLAVDKVHPMVKNVGIRIYTTRYSTSEHTVVFQNHRQTHAAMQEKFTCLLLLSSPSVCIAGRANRTSHGTRTSRP